MPEQSPHLRIAQMASIHIVTMTDRKILDEVNINQIGEQLNGLIAKSAQPKMVLDFTNVSHMSSSALGMLILLHKRIRQKNGQLRLCCIQPNIYEVFVITRLNEILKITSTQQESIDSLL